MAEKVISDYTAAATIDALADYLLIENGALSAYRKINRNVLLGITGSPVGTSDSQTLSNKVLTSPTISGPTLSGTVSGTYTLGGTPTFPAAVVTLTGSQTLTNKTITAPAITNGTIDNTTITVDAISGHTTPTIVSVGGVSLNNGTIGTASAVTSAAIADGAVIPNKLTTGSGSGWSWQVFSPSWTNFTPGNGTITALYTQTGKKINVFMAILFGTTTVVSGDVSFVPPVPASAVYTSVGINVVTGYGQMVAGSTFAPCLPFFNISNAVLHVGYAAATTGALTATSASLPGIWTTNNLIQFTAEYEAS